MIGYVTSWGIYERDFQIADIPADQLTHVNYAFANVVNGKCAVGDRWADIDRPLPTDDLSLSYRGNFNQLNVLKAQHPHLKTLLSVGGSTWSGGFSAATATVSDRRAFAASCVDFMVRYGFDGLDIDWEYPGWRNGRAEDRANFTKFLTELRAQLDAVGMSTGKRPLLTIAAPAGPTTMALFDIPGIIPMLDWVNVMTYDFAGSWSPRTGHNAPLYAYPGIEDKTFTVDSGMQRWVAAGAPPRKLAVGLAFYGRGFGGVNSTSPGSAFSSLPMGTSELAQYDFSHLVTDVLTNMIVRFDETAMVPYAYNPSERVWISYDDARSIEEKARYAGRNGFGGAMIWELSNDTEGELLRAALRGLEK